MEGALAVGEADTPIFNLRGDIEKTFRPEEKSVPRPWVATADPQVAVQF